MAYQRVLTIQDISCVGQCSLTVALPIISSCGLEACPLPSAVLSTHTGGFKGYTFRDLTEDIPLIEQHWKKEGILFDAFYTGYLGSVKQIAYVKDIISSMGKPGAKKIIDPAMADNGKLYPGFDESFVKAMTGLCASGDIVLPNITEASLMTGLPYKEQYDMGYVDSLLDALVACGMKTIILKGISLEPGKTGVIIAEAEGRRLYRHKKVDRSCHGTGDVFASAFVGAFVQGVPLYDSARIAADYTLACIEGTVDDQSHWYGVKFEPELPGLIAAIHRQKG
ncbi:MAG: pyridoxamine kinase [Bacteroidales bacterium]|jgi:pyridoxine kinase|nr:pyridoxamine kinase [Bacteroidales bacterium]